MVQTPTHKHRVVVIGGGFAGLACIKGLKGADVDITLVDQHNHHLFQPLLYQVATTILPPSEIAWSLRRILQDRSDVTTLLAQAQDVDRNAKTVALSTGQTLPYDTLVVATGARHAYFGNDHWADHAPGLKTLDDARDLRHRILGAFERAEQTDDDSTRDANLTFAVIGGGPTGVEMAGTIAELAHRILPRQYRRADTRTARVVLIEAGPRLLNGFSEKTSAYAKQALEQQGVEVLLNKPVTHCDDQGLIRDGDTLPCHTIVWAAGVQASPLNTALNADQDRAGRIRVGDDLTLPLDKAVFVVGDTTAIADASGNPVPGIAPAAKQMGAYAAKMIRARLSGKPAPQAFRYRHMGNLATIGRKAAVVEYNGFKLRGVLAWWVWGIAHIYFLIGTRNRVAVAWNWLWTYATGQGGAALITNTAPISPVEKPVPS